VTVRPIRTFRAIETTGASATDVAVALGRYGAEAGHYSVLGPDPWRFLWTPGRTGFIAFLESPRCVLAWRSPVAAPEDQAGLLGDLLAFARETRRQLIAVPVNEATRAAGERLGMLASWVGTECYLDLPAWSLAGGRREKVRWARSHALAHGLHWREAHPLADARDRDGLARVEQSWKAERPERGTDSFLRTSFEELITIRRFFVAEGPDGIVASVTCAPVNARTWYLQDPVRAPDAVRGALEGAMALALDTLRDEGYDCVDNGPLTFWRPDGDADPSHPLGIFGDLVIRRFDRRYRFHGINQFRAKFEPDRTDPVYVLRSHRWVTPGVARSLTRLLTSSAPR